MNLYLYTLLMIYKIKKISMGIMASNTNIAVLTGSRVFSCHFDQPIDVFLTSF